MRRAAVIAMLLCAAPQAALAYRTSADVYPELAGAGPVRWASPPSYDIAAAGGPGVSAASVQAAADEAFHRWGSLACGVVQVTYGTTSENGPTPDDGRNTIGWVPVNWAERGFPQDAVATTDLNFVRMPDGSWQIVEADIYLNGADYSWSPESGDSSTNLRSATAVITHEAGHFLGMGHPCEVGGNGAPDCAADPTLMADVMYPTYLGADHLALAPDDEAGACYLYGCEVAGCAAGLMCGAAGCGEACGTGICAPGEHCLSGACAPPCSAPSCLPGRCARDADCSTGQRCIDGLCVVAGAPEGDPCTTGTSCASGICAEEGYCTAACSAASSCTTGLTCAVSGLCVASGGVFGDPCNAAGDCSTELCASSASRSFCTRACDDLHVCPTSFDCNALDTHRVCLPHPSSGCTIGTRSTRDAQFTFLFLVAALILARRRTT